MSLVSQYIRYGCRRPGSLLFPFLLRCDFFYARCARVSELLTCDMWMRERERARDLIERFGDPDSITSSVRLWDCLFFPYIQYILHRLINRGSDWWGESLRGMMCKPAKTYGWWDGTLLTPITSQLSRTDPFEQLPLDNLTSTREPCTAEKNPRELHTYIHT